MTICLFVLPSVASTSYVTLELSHQGSFSSSVTPPLLTAGLSNIRLQLTTTELASVSLLSFNATSLLQMSLVKKSLSSAQQPANQERRYIKLQFLLLSLGGETKVPPSSRFRHPGPQSHRSSWNKFLRPNPAGAAYLTIPEGKARLSENAVDGGGGFCEF